MKNNHLKRGQALIVIALAAVALVGMVGLVVDGGRGFLDRRKAQNAADAAARGGASGAQHHGLRLRLQEVRRLGPEPAD